MDYKIWLAFAVGMLIGMSLGVIIISMMHTAATRIVFVPMPVSESKTNNEMQNHG